jgi:hypothetical protein
MLKYCFLLCQHSSLDSFLCTDMAKERKNEVEESQTSSLWYVPFMLCKRVSSTEKRTDVWSRDFIIWKINSGLWAVVWAGLWNKRVGADYEQLFRSVFLSFYGQKINLNFFWKYFRVRTQKLHRIKVNKSQKKFGQYFLWGKTSFFRAKNLSVNTWRSGPDIWSLICG